MLLVPSFTKRNWSPVFADHFTSESEIQPSPTNSRESTDPLLQHLHQTCAPFFSLCFILPSVLLCTRMDRNSRDRWTASHARITFYTEHRYRFYPNAAVCLPSHPLYLDSTVYFPSMRSCPTAFPPNPRKTTLGECTTGVRMCTCAGKILESRIFQCQQQLSWLAWRIREWFPASVQPRGRSFLLFLTIELRSFRPAERMAGYIHGPSWTEIHGSPFCRPREMRVLSVLIANGEGIALVSILVLLLEKLLCHKYDFKIRQKAVKWKLNITEWFLIKNINFP